MSTPISSCEQFLGKRAREIIEAYAEVVSFVVPEAAYAEAEEHLAAMVIKRGGNPEKALALLHALGRLVELIGSDVYGTFEAVARERLHHRDPDDWPSIGASVSDLDRRHRFLRLRRCHMDLGSHRDVSARGMLECAISRCGERRVHEHLEMRSTREHLAGVRENRLTSIRRQTCRRKIDIFAAA